MLPGESRIHVQDEDGIRLSGSVRCRTARDTTIVVVKPANGESRTEFLYPSHRKSLLVDGECFGRVMMCGSANGSRSLATKFDRITCNWWRGRFLFSSCQ